MDQPALDILRQAQVDQQQVLREPRAGDITLMMIVVVVDFSLLVVSSKADASMAFIPVTGVNYDHLHSVYQFALDRTELCKAFEDHFHSINSAY